MLAQVSVKRQGCSYWRQSQRPEEPRAINFERVRLERGARIGGNVRDGGDCAIVTVLLCKREAVWRRSVGQLMRRSGRVNQLTSGPSTHPSTFLLLPLCQRQLLLAGHTTGTHQLASGRSCNHSGQVVSLFFPLLRPPLLLVFVLLSDRPSSSSALPAVASDVPFLPSRFLHGLNRPVDRLLILRRRGEFRTPQVGK